MTGVVIRIVLTAIAAVSAAGTACAPHSTTVASSFVLQPGDLLFQDLDAGPLCDAIEEVTVGCNGGHFTHVGVVCQREPRNQSAGSASAPGDCLVLEAVSEGVRVIPLGQFLERSKDAQNSPKVVVGRLKTEHQPLVPAAVEYGLSLAGRPYDRVFEIGNDAYYCSELIFEMFAHANGSEPVFHLQPMTFKDPDSGATLPVWAEYFDQQGVPVPEGRPGINPGGISRSPRIDIVHLYGTPAGWNERRGESE